MVNNINLSLYSGFLPLNLNTNNRKIPGGPLYGKTSVLSLLSGGEDIIKPWTRDCVKDLQQLSFDNNDVIDLLKHALDMGKFKGSAWCQSKPGGAWAACDSYQVFRDEHNKYMDKELQVEYYIKFAIGKNNNLILTISCHT